MSSGSASMSPNRRCIPSWRAVISGWQNLDDVLRRSSFTVRGGYSGHQPSHVDIHLWLNMLSALRLGSWLTHIPSRKQVLQGWNFNTQYQNLQNVIKRYEKYFTQCDSTSEYSEYSAFLNISTCISIHLKITAIPTKMFMQDCAFSCKKLLKYEIVACQIIRDRHKDMTQTWLIS